MKLGWPPYSYDPVRANHLDILNVDAGPLAALPRTPWATIAAEITRRCFGDSAAIDANLNVAEGLYQFASERNLIGRRHEFYSFAIGIATKVKYWSPLVVAIDDQPVVPFMDFRRTKKLTAEGRRFVFSMMNEHIRLADPDFAGVRLAILQFANSKGGIRPVISHFDDEVHLWGMADLQEMIRETYELWYEILDDRAAEARRSAGKGPLI